MELRELPRLAFLNIYGPPNTGKTLAVRICLAALGLQVMPDLPALVLNGATLSSMTELANYLTGIPIILNDSIDIQCQSLRQFLRSCFDRGNDLTIKHGQRKTNVNLIAVTNVPYFGYGELFEEADRQRVMLVRFADENVHYSEEKINVCIHQTLAYRTLHNVLILLLTSRN